MTSRSILAAFAFCASLGASLVHAVTCAPNMPPASNPDSAYTDNGNGTVTHQPTGLTWKRCAEGQIWTGSTCSGTAGRFTWAQALTQARNSSFAGQGDWRLPNMKELGSLVELCRLPAINDTIFPNTPSNFFWSGSPYAYLPIMGWSVDFTDGRIGNAFLSSEYAVRLVRGGQSSGSFGLAVTATGTGSGTLTSSTGDINCASAAGTTTGTCFASYSSGTAVTITATPASGSSFTGWSGACSGTASTCTVMMDAAKSVGAAFTKISPASFVLTASANGTGSGTVSSNSGGINCVSAAGTTTGSCSATYNSGTTVTLTASSASGSRFVGWSGACVGMASVCTVQINEAKSVRASFAVNDRNMIVNPSFEDGDTGWTQYSSAGRVLIMQRMEGHMGSYIAGLGSGNNVRDYIEQSLNIPREAKKAILEFWYFIGTEEPNAGIAYDTFTVELYSSAGSHLTTLATLSNLDDTHMAWTKKRVRVNLAPYAGQTVRLRFSGAINGSNSSLMALDDISLMLSSSGIGIAPIISLLMDSSPPGAPSIWAISPGNSKAQVFFTAPAEQREAPIDNYQATCGSAKQQGSTSPIVVNWLVNDTKYDCTVQAHNSNGWSSNSAVQTITPYASTYNLSSGFSATSNPSGQWKYGRFATLPASSGGAFSLYDTHSYDAKYPSLANWFGSTGSSALSANISDIQMTFYDYVVLPAKSVSLHPGNNGEESAVAWETPPTSFPYKYVTGYTFSGYAQRAHTLACSKSVNVYMRYGTTIYPTMQLFSYGDRRYFQGNISTPTPGQNLFLVVNYGEEKDWSCDGTLVDMTISDVP